MTHHSMEPHEQKNILKSECMHDFICMDYACNTRADYSAIAQQQTQQGQKEFRCERLFELSMKKTLHAKPRDK